jgi:hypothetical protein
MHSKFEEKPTAYRPNKPFEFRMLERGEIRTDENSGRTYKKQWAARKLPDLNTVTRTQR